MHPCIPHARKKVSPALQYSSYPHAILSTAAPGRESGEGHFSRKPRMTRRNVVLFSPHGRNKPPNPPGMQLRGLGKGERALPVQRDARSCRMRPRGKGERAFPIQPVPGMEERSPPVPRASPGGTCACPPPPGPRPSPAVRTDPKEPAGGGAAQHGPSEGAESAEQHLSPTQVGVFGPGPSRQFPTAVSASLYRFRQTPVTSFQQLPVTGHRFGSRHGDPAAGVQLCPPMAPALPAGSAQAPRRGGTGDGTPLPAVTGP